MFASDRAWAQQGLLWTLDLMCMPRLMMACAICIYKGQEPWLFSVQWCSGKSKQNNVYLSAENIICSETFEFTPSFEKIKKICSEERFKYCLLLIFCSDFFILPRWRSKLLSSTHRHTSVTELVTWQVSKLFHSYLSRNCLVPTLAQADRLPAIMGDRVEWIIQAELFTFVNNIPPFRPIIHWCY